MGKVNRKPEEKEKKGKKYSWLKLEQKVEIVKQVQNGKTKAEVARQFKTTEATVYRTWLKREDILNHVKLSDSNILKNSSMIRPASFVRMEKLLLIWINDCVSKRIPLSKNLIMARAETIHEVITKPSPITFTYTNSHGDSNSRDVSLDTSNSSTHSRLDSNSQDNTDSRDVSLDTSNSSSDDSPKKKFKASKGQFEKFKSRSGIHSIRIKGESASANEDAAKEFPNQLKELMEKLGVTKDQVFNADETALMWKMLPTRSYVLDNQKSMAGYKGQKDRLTFLLGGKRLQIKGEVFVSSHF